NPQIVWEWYNWRRELLSAKTPNAAHDGISQLEQRIENFWLITQNVDGLHTQAGSNNLSEIHGNIWKVRCTACGLVTDNREVPLVYPPTCGACSGLLRPHIVWFGESLNHDDLNNSFAALQQCEILLVIGTSGIVYPAASFASVAKNHGALVVEVNLDTTPNSSLVDVSFQGRAKDLVPLLLSNT
ncbi:MAG: Sir2 family NAD-dependent protein deacetylase, partial [Nitrospirales bacterium]